MTRLATLSTLHGVTGLSKDYQDVCVLVESVAVDCPKGSPAVRVGPPRWSDNRHLREVDWAACEVGCSV